MTASSSAFDRALELTRPAGRRAAGRFLAEGPHVVAEALAAHAAVEDLFVAGEPSESPELAKLLDLARHADARAYRLTPRQLGRLADTETPQGVIAVVRMPDLPPAPFAAAGTWLLLDGVQDPGNVGTLLRSADAFGARGAIAGPGTADLWSGKVLRGAQGAHFRLTLLTGDPAPHLDAFQAAGGELWAAAQDGASVYEVSAPPARLVLALGSEARGLSDSVLARARRRVAVPQRGGAESLNVAVAGSILLSRLSELQAARPRRPKR